MDDTAKDLLHKIRKNSAFGSSKSGPTNDDYWFGDQGPAKTEEEELRDEFPSLQDAWEKYQIVLKMVKASKPKKETAADILDQIRKKKANDPTTTATQKRFKEIARKFSK